MKIYTAVNIIACTIIAWLQLPAQNNCPPFTNSTNTVVSANTISSVQDYNVQFTMEGLSDCGTAFYLFEDGMFATQPNPQHSFYSTGNFTVKYYALEAYEPSPPQERSIDSVNQQPNTTVTVHNAPSLSNNLNNLYMPPGTNIILGQSWDAAIQNKVIYLLAFMHPGNDTSAVDGNIKLALDANVQFSKVITPDGTNISPNNWAISNYNSSTHEVEFVFQNLGQGIHNMRHLYVEVDIPNIPATINTLSNTAKIEVKGGIKEFTLTSQIRQYPHDPNGIQIMEDCLQANLDTKQTLNYNISFQNEGEAYAENVKIETDLGPFIHLSSFTITKASNPIDSVYINDNGLLVFEFYDINLPGLNQHHPHQYYPNQTKGFVQFSIDTEDKLESHNKILSAAEIYFDSQPPIHTGYDSVKISNCCHDPNDCDSGRELESTSQVSVYPTPLTNHCTIKYDVTERHQLVKIQLFSISGQRLGAPLYQGMQQKGVYENSYSLAKLPAGVYLLRVQIGTSIETIKLIKL